MAFFCFLLTSSDQSYTLNFVNATRKCEHRRTSKNTLLELKQIYAMTQGNLNYFWTFKLRNSELEIYQLGSLFSETLFFQKGFYSLIFNTWNSFSCLLWSFWAIAYQNWPMFDRTVTFWKHPLFRDFVKFGQKSRCAIKRNKTNVWSRNNLDFLAMTVFSLSQILSGHILKSLTQ